MKTRIFTLFILAAFTLSGVAAVKGKAVPVDGLKFQKTPMMKAPSAATSADVFYESFDNGVGEWVLIDESPDAAFEMQFGALGGLSAVSGTKYLISGYDEVSARDAWAISPGVLLLPATTYYLSAFIYTPGWEGFLDSLSFTIGTDNTILAQTRSLLQTKQETEGWTLVSVEFTVDAEALYNFGIHHASAEIGINAVGVEDFRISLDAPVAPKPLVKKVDLFGGVWNYEGPSTLNLFEDNDTILAVPHVLFADSYLWTSDGGVTIDPDSLFYAYLGYPTAGDYNLSLKVTNAEGDTTAVVPFTVNFPADGQDGALWINKAPAENLVGQFTFVNGQDVFGLNDSYSSLIERYYLPEGVYAGVDSVILSVEKYFLQEENASKTFTVRLLGADANGYPKDNWEFGRFEGTFASVFGESIENSTDVVVKFPATVGVKGSFFVAVDLATAGDTIDLSEGRDFLAFNFVYRGTASYATATSYIDYPSNGWIPFFEYIEALTSGSFSYAMSLGFIPSVKMGFVEGTIEELSTAITILKADSKLSVYPNPAKDMLYISSLADNSSISIADITGKQVAAYRANTVQNGVSISGLSAGLYIITVKDAAGIHTAKFVKE